MKISKIWTVFFKTNIILLFLVVSSHSLWGDENTALKEMSELYVNKAKGYISSSDISGYKNYLLSNELDKTFKIDINSNIIDEYQTSYIIGLLFGSIGYVAEEISKNNPLILKNDPEFEDMLAICAIEFKNVEYTSGFIRDNIKKIRKYQTKYPDSLFFLLTAMAYAHLTSINDSIIKVTKTNVKDGKILVYIEIKNTTSNIFNVNLMGDKLYLVDGKNQIILDTQSLLLIQDHFISASIMPDLSIGGWVAFIPKQIQYNYQIIYKQFNTDNFIVTDFFDRTFPKKIKDMKVSF